MAAMTSSSVPLLVKSKPENNDGYSPSSPSSPCSPDGSSSSATDPLSLHDSTGTTDNQPAPMDHPNSMAVDEPLGGSTEIGQTVNGQPTPSGRHVDDGGTLSLPEEKLMQIAKRFQPIVWLDRNEIYRPCTIDWYLKHSILYYDPTGREQVESYIPLKRGDVTESDLTLDALFARLSKYQEEHHDPRLLRLTKDNVERRRFHLAAMDKASQAGADWHDVNKVPFLTRLRRYEDRWEIIYMSTFAYNGPYRICGRWAGAHSFDLEHITVRTNADATRLEWVYYSAHGITDGEWRRFDEIESERYDQPQPTRPIVYAAVNSHGHYYRPGTWWRICGFANDVADSADDSSSSPRSRWDPTLPPQILYMPSDPRYGSGVGMKYLEYPGTFGEDGVSPPHLQGWWNHESQYTNNCVRRCWWPCRYISWSGDNDLCYNACQKKVDFSQLPITTAKHSYTGQNGFVRVAQPERQTME